MRTRLFTAALLAAAAPVSAQSIAITGGRVFPVSGPVIENGTVLIRDGRITAVGSGIAIPADARRVDATGRWVTPGLVNAATSIGLQEIGSVGSTVETAPRGTLQLQRGISASFNVWEGFNPASVLIPAARKAGVTTVAVLPSGGLVSGRGAVMHLVAGGGLTEMLMRSPVAMIAQVGGGSTRGEQWSRLREVLDDARAYSRRRAEFERAATRPFAATRLDLEALVPVVEGRLPLLLEVDRASDIEAALILARDYRLRLMIGGGAEAWMVAAKLAAARVPVFTGAMNNIPENFSSLGQRQENAGLLRRAGVAVTIIGNAGGGGDEEAFNVRNVRFEAGNAVAYGMTWDDALRAVTLTPAEQFGVADRVGSLQVGRDADVVIWTGDPFEFASQPERVFLRGVEATGPSRQDLLEQRYKTLPPSFRQP